MSLKRLGRQRRSGEVIAHEVKAPRDATDEGFVGCLGQFQFVKSLVQCAHCTAQLAVAAREHQDVVHVSHIEQAPAGKPVVECLQVQRAEQRAQWAAARDAGAYVAPQATTLDTALNGLAQ